MCAYVCVCVSVRVHVCIRMRVLKYADITS